VKETPIKALSHLQPIRIYTYLQQHQNKSILLIGHPPVKPTVSERKSDTGRESGPRCRNRLNVKHIINKISATENLSGQAQQLKNLRSMQLSQAPTRFPTPRPIPSLGLGARPRNSKEQKQAEKDSAEAVQAAIDAREEPPPLPPWSKEEPKFEPS